MSEYIYGSSLRAAKSKANYLFEGDFRRRPNQNLSGASRSLARGELLQQAAEQRQNREDVRRKEQASLKIQSVWRGYCCRQKGRSKMRSVFDNMIQTFKSHDNKFILTEDTFETLSRQFIIYYHSETDKSCFESLIDLILQQQDMVVELKKKDPKIWLYRIIKLLTMNLKPLEQSCDTTKSKHLVLLERFTRVDSVLDKTQATSLWTNLIERNIYKTLRHLVDLNNKKAEDSQAFDTDFSRILIELVRRSLDIEQEQNVLRSTIPTCSFFNEFLHGPLDQALDFYYLPKLIVLKPKGLQAKNILSAFKTSNIYSSRGVQLTSLNQLQESSDAIWLCYSFVRTVYTQLDHLEDSDKVDYINLLSILIAPGEYITNISLLQANNEEDVDQNDEDFDDIDVISRNNQINQYNIEINSVITRLVYIINDAPHITGLKSIIFSSELQAKVQPAIINICNLMLAHEPLAIFQCRLLYTVAFSREFSRSLWKSIISSSNSSLYGTNPPIYMQIIRGNSISHDSWKSILPQLRLFCSLYSYLMPTLDDEEFYTDDEIPIYARNRETKELEGKEQSRQKKSTNSTTFFTDKELVTIIAVLRDICVGFIEYLYQDNRHVYSLTARRFDQNFCNETTRLLSFEIKMCFKALVRLVCQLHARDSRKQFCPDGHWICPSVIIPANKAIDFQLVTSRQGRLLSKMTKNESTNDKVSNTSTEVKTVLILQEIPFVISFHDRVQILHELLSKERQIHQSEGYHFGLPGTAIQVQIRRNYIYEDAFEKLSLENEPNMKLPLKISLINAVGADEAGIDGGGLSKEFLSELLKAGFDPMRGFFKSTKDQLLYPNPSANVLFSNLPGGYEVHFEFLGRMLGKAIFEKIMVELPLASFFLAKLLARKHSSDVDLHNLASLDPILYKNLIYLKNYKGDVADLNLDFTISNNELDEHEVVELKPGGSKIPVTRENKIEYVHLVADYRLNKQIRAQCAAFRRGLAQLIDLDWLRMFDPRELQILISGAPTVIDIADWRRHTQYANGYTDKSEAINTFWRVAEQLDESQKRKLLKFATSCSLPPLLGFKDLVPQFTIAPSEEKRLPTASTCMNLLKLPECEDEKAMRSKLLYAIESNSGFELS